MVKRAISVFIRTLIILSTLTMVTPAAGSPVQQTDQPDIDVSPTSISVNLPPGGSTTRPLTVANQGGAVLRFDARVNATLGASAAAKGFEPLTFPDEKVEPGLRESVRNAPGGKDHFLVYLTAQADLSPAYRIEDRAERGRFVYNALWEIAQSSQTELIDYLEGQKAAGRVSEYRSYYIVNAILVTGEVEVIDALAENPQVAYLEAVETYSIPQPSPGLLSEPSAIEWGVSRIGADRVWSDFNVRGEGIVVANIDTGVLYNHTALSSQYRGAATGSHDYNWFDPAGSSAPNDGNGHGTHTMGTMVGDDGGNNKIGAAPSARWIAAKGCASYYCSESDLLASAEWVLAPYPIGGSPSNGNPEMRPHVVNNSWGGGGGDIWYRASVNAWRAADIFPAFSAGNSGPGSGSIGSPADYAESFAIGATDINDNIASFSSRGPSQLTNETKPDVSAPGVNVRSSWNDGGYNTISGTSMASPHLSGCVALIRSAKPDLDVTSIEDILTGSAFDLGQSGPDYTYVYGRIDCHAAVARAKASWLSVSPLSGSVASGASTTLTATFDATGLTAGTYQGSLVIFSNDPDENPVTVPVTLTVGGTAPTVTPTGTATSTATPTGTTLPPTVTPTQTALPPTVTPTRTALPPTVTSTSPPPGVVFADDFESDRGWIPNPFGSDTATTGNWERGQPQDTSYTGLPLQLGAPTSGSSDLVTGALAGASVGDNDIDNGVTSIRSPQIALPAGGQLSLSFNYYLAHLSNASADDFLRVSVLGDATETVFELRGSPTELAAAWRSTSVSLDAFAGQKVYLLVEAADSATPSLVEAAIDDVKITYAGQITPLPPTVTPTSFPGKPELVQPADGATLPQPLPPEEWLFTWNARVASCFSVITINGPENTEIVSPPIPPSYGIPPYSYHYSATEPLPEGTWTWYVVISCPLGNNRSDTRTFYLTATPTVTPTVTSTLPAPPGVVFADDFESDRGWIPNPFGSDTATTGNWERGQPQDTSYTGLPLQLGAPTSGSSDLVTGALAGASVGDNDIDNGVTSIRSPQIALPAGGQLSLSFNYYLAHLSNASADDFLRVSVLGDATETVFELRGSPTDTAAAWRSTSVSLDAFAGQKVYLLVEAADSATPSLVEAAIDDVLIEFSP